MNRIKKTKRILSRKSIYTISLAVMLIIVFAISMTGCSDQKAKRDIHKTNKYAIEEVLRKSLTCPNLNLSELREDVSIIGNDSDINIDSKLFTNGSLAEELESMYKPFLTEKYFDLFIGKHALSFEIVADRAGYEISVDNIDVVPKENDTTGYDFKVNVTYWKDPAQKSKAEISGIAQCAEEGKISFMNYFDDGGLMNSMK